MKSYLLLFLVCASFIWNVTKSDGDRLEYSLIEAGCSVVIPNKYVQSCFLTVNDDLMDDFGLVHSLQFEFEITEPVGDGCEVKVEAWQGGVATGIAILVTMQDLVEKENDPLADEFCGLTNLPKGQYPIKVGTYGSLNHNVSDTVLPVALLGGTYNITISIMMKGVRMCEMFMVAEVYS